MRAGLAPVPLYIHAPHEEGAWAPGAASMAWRHRALAQLDSDLRAIGSRLHLFAGDSAAVLHRVAKEVGAKRPIEEMEHPPKTM